MIKNISRVIAVAVATIMCAGAMGCQKTSSQAPTSEETTTVKVTDAESTEEQTTEVATTETTTAEATTAEATTAEATTAEATTAETTTAETTTTEAQTEATVIQSSRDFFRDNTATISTSDGKIIVELGFDSSYAKYELNYDSLHLTSYETMEGAEWPLVNAKVSILTGYASYEDYAAQLLNHYIEIGAETKYVSKDAEGTFCDRRYVVGESLFRSETDIGESDFIYIEIEDGIAVYVDFGSVRFGDYKDVICGALEITNVVKL